MPQLSYLSEFRLKVSDAQGLIISAHDPNTNSIPTWNQANVFTITEAALLKIFIAWEHYIESSLLGYINGEASINGTVITRYAAPTSLEHARKILIGTQKYVDFSNAEIIRKLARLYLENGEPYETVLLGIQSHLSDFKTIRNATAHLSSTTSSALDALALRVLGTPSAGISVYGLITSVDPRAGNGNTVLQTFIDHIDLAADQIANA